jgi:hypothetical protein
MHRPGRQTPPTFAVLVSNQTGPPEPVCSRTRVPPLSQAPRVLPRFLGRLSQQARLPGQCNGNQTRARASTPSTSPRTQRRRGAERAREGAVGEGAEQVSPRNSVRRGLVRIIQSYRSPKPPWNLSLKWCRIAAGDDACWSPSWCSSLPLRPGSSFSLIVSSE